MRYLLSVSLVLIIVSCTVSTDKQSTKQKPNVLFICVDLFAEGNDAVEIGSWTKFDSSGTEILKGNYMSYFQKRDGKYICVRDMSTTSSPAKK